MAFTLKLSKRFTCGGHLLNIVLFTIMAYKTPPPPFPSTFQKKKKEEKKKKKRSLKQKTSSWVLYAKLRRYLGYTDAADCQ